MTEEVVRSVSRLLGQDFSDDINDSDMKSAQQKAESLITEMRSFQQSDPDEEAATQFLLKMYNQVAADILEVDEIETESVESLKDIFDAIGSIINNYRIEGEEFGYPEYFDTVEVIAENLVNQDDSEKFINEIRTVQQELGEKKLQRLLARYDTDLKYISENHKIADKSTVERYLEMYEYYCEQFRTLSPFIIYAVNAVENGRGDIDERLTDRLDTLISMCSSRDQIEIFGEPFDSDLRNAVAHPDYLLDPIESKVEYAANGEDETLSYTELRDLVVESRCATQALIMFPLMLEHKRNLLHLEEILADSN